MSELPNMAALYLPIHFGSEVVSGLNCVVVFTSLNRSDCFIPASLLNCPAWRSGTKATIEQHADSMAVRSGGLGAARGRLDTLWQGKHKNSGCRCLMPMKKWRSRIETNRTTVCHFERSEKSACPLRMQTADSSALRNDKIQDTGAYLL